MNPLILTNRKLVGGFWHAESKTGLSYGLSQLLDRVLTTACPKHNSFPRLLGKIRLSDFLDFTPLSYFDPDGLKYDTAHEKL